MHMYNFHLGMNNEAIMLKKVMQYTSPKEIAQAECAAF